MIRSSAKARIVALLFLFILPATLLGQAVLSSLSVVPDDSTAGGIGIHTISFTTFHSIPLDGRIVVIYPAGFDATVASIASSTTLDGTLTVTHSGNSVIISRSGGTTSVAGNSEVLKLANIINSQTAGTHSIVVQTETIGGIIIDSGTFNNFTVTAGKLDHFGFSAVTSPQTAGSAFPFTITALDHYGNQVSDYNQIAFMDDSTGTVSPEQISFSSGIWSGDVTITGSHSSDRLIVTGSGKSNSSDPFSVFPATVDYFVISPITSPQVAGTSFSITLTAKDIYGNKATGFSGTVSISDGTGTLSPATSGSFTGGVRSEPVRITHTASDVVISIDDGANHIGVSNTFNVKSGSLNRFSIASIPAQATGLPFTLSLTAEDEYGNIVTDFSGSGARVDIDHTGVGPITPTQSGDFTNGLWSGTVTVSQAQNSDQISVIRSGGSETGLSNNFSVSPSSVDHFAISAIGASQTAGVPFVITVTAKDASGNTVTGFTDIVTLSDQTGSITSLTNLPVSNGVWSGSVTIEKSWQNDFLTVTGVGISSNSNLFNVTANTISTFQIDQISSPQQVGVNFSITITALDAYGNIATGFSDRANLNDDTGSLIPSLSGYFNNGVRTELVTVTQAYSDIRISVDDGYGHSGQSNLFNVIPGVVDHFDVFLSGNQVAGDPFTIQVIARDLYDNTASSFTGTVNLSDNTGTIRPQISSSFTTGQWVGSITVDQPIASDYITVQNSSGSETGQSAAFEVVEAPGIRMLAAIASQHQVTAGQNEDWTLSYVLTNLASHEAQLDSIHLSFLLYGQTQSDYVYQRPTSFLTSGNGMLPGNSTDTLVVTITSTGHERGPVFVQGSVYCLDSNTGRIVQSRGETGIAVQDSARLDIFTLSASQSQITAGQDSTWYIKMAVQNTGEAVLRIDSLAAATGLVFDLGSGWTVDPPLSLKGGGWELSGGELDSLVYGITHSGDGNTGVCTIHGLLTATELNTGRTVYDNTGDHGSVSVLLEEKATLRIIGARIIAPNAPRVNTGQNFYIRGKVQNSGEDGAHDLLVSLTSDGYSIFPQSVNAHLDHLAGGAIDSVDILVQAAGEPSGGERFTVRVQGYSDNTNTLFQGVLSPFDYTDAVIQERAAFDLRQFFPSKDLVIAGQIDPWKIKAAIRNSGDAALVLTPQNSDITFFKGSTKQIDYIVEAPTQLSGGGLLLEDGEVDTLTYRVTTTGRLGGDITIRGNFSGTDQNDGTSVAGAATSGISVQAETDFRIISTSVKTPNTTDAGNGVVNTGQDFQIKTVIENGLGESVRDIQVHLISNGGSIITTPYEIISRLQPSQSDSVFFTVTAASQENQTGELFATEIVSAELETSGSSAHVGNPIDASALVFIQSPPRLQLAIDLTPASTQFTTEQNFTLAARLINLGSGHVDDSGIVKITVPENYTLVSQDATVGIEADSSVIWQIRSPNQPHGDPRALQVTLVKAPLDINTGNTAVVMNESVQVEVKTVEVSLASELSIATPLGARDGVVSTGQYFVVRAFIQWKNVEKIEATLTLPAGYTTSDNLVKSVISPEVYWQLKAPSSPAGTRNIQVAVTGYDSFLPERSVTGQGDLVSVICQSRADLFLQLTASDNSVSLGQVFTVYGSVSNSGTADTLGACQVTLQPLPGGYTTSESMTKTLVSGQATWLVKAPISPTQEAVNIVGTITKIPQDENTNEAAYIDQLTDKVAVTTVGAWLAVDGIALPDTLSGLIVPGQTNIWLGGLMMINKGEQGANGIVIKNIKFDVEDNSGLPVSPASVLTQFNIMGLTKSGSGWQPDPTRLYGQVNGQAISASNPLSVPLLNELNIAAGDTARISFIGSVSAADTVSGFRLNLKNGSYISAQDEYSPLIDIQVKDVTGTEFANLRGFSKQVIPVNQSESQEPYLANCPNPFGQPGKETTTFAYYLAEDSNITFTIVTLTGELVWTRSYPSGSKQATAGLHSLGSGAVVWDGRNDASHKVLSGVYITYLETGDGKRVFTKTAVVW